MNSSSVKTHPYTPPTESDNVQQPGAYAVATPIDSVANSRSVRGSSTSRSSVNTATLSQPPSPPVVYTQSMKHTEPAQMVNDNKYVFVDSRKPVSLTYCPKCYEENIATRTHTKSNGTTALCVVAGVVIFWPLCWLPLCIKSMKQTNHYCTKCGCKVGRVKPFQ
ncbi:LITAF-like zinc ribbon domain containing protein [Nitzschia inconspicua]|uniref:LITAF-like zinc ribbon domain containing protein n=1 Tax=Nitzschia inconspicua TaxID=303405 RepID=A0A9K3M6X7_9STRA|nr:LITAF-like zinc ribbon domain containing protein [Nitzschia inconspicua]